MKNSIPQYTFYKTKYGSELLIDVVELKYIKRFLSENPIHTLTYYDITFITEGRGVSLSIIRIMKRLLATCFFLSRGKYGVGIRII